MGKGSGGTRNAKSGNDSRNNIESLSADEERWLNSKFSIERQISIKSGIDAEEMYAKTLQLGDTRLSIEETSDYEQSTDENRDFKLSFFDTNNGGTLEAEFSVKNNRRAGETAVKEIKKWIKKFIKDNPQYD